jgi:hypothetical protein
MQWPVISSKDARDIQRLQIWEAYLESLMD